MRALDNAILDETELASQVSDEEWEAIRPNKIDRRDFLLQNVKVCFLFIGHSQQRICYSSPLLSNIKIVLNIP